MPPASAQPALAADEGGNFGHALTMAKLGHDEGAAAARGAGVGFQKRQINAHMGARSVLFTTRRSDFVTPGPRLRGISCPAAVSIT